MISGDSPANRRWICCQLGAREHYAVARSLAREGQLDCVVTDVWADPTGLFGWFPARRARDRFHEELRGARVAAANTAAAAFELRNRRRLSGWELIERRNDWFEQHAVRALEQAAQRLGRHEVAVFAYSYAAGRIFEFARRMGWKTILGQIDPGPFEDRLVAERHEQLQGCSSEWTPAPESYWRRWRQETELADRIVVNSEWSRQALVREGVAAEKMLIVPLTYEPSPEAAAFHREYPTRFDESRPLRVLFLGQANIRKGIDVLVRAAELLLGEPVEFRVVGPIQVTGLQGTGRVEWVGPVPRSATFEEYRRADAFLFPTHSDGFGLTQLEAMAWKLPVIASAACGDVVEHLRNGYRLEDVSAEAVAQAIRFILREPVSLRRMSAACAQSRAAQFGLADVARGMDAAADQSCARTACGTAGERT